MGVIEQNHSTNKYRAICKRCRYQGSERDKKELAQMDLKAHNNTENHKKLAKTKRPKYS